jgi:hypothetical protein
MQKSDHKVKTESPGKALAHDLVDRIEELLQSAAASGQPIQIDPQRSRLFELFVMSEATGFLEEGGEEDLSCDGVARALADRWKLARDLGRPELSQVASMPPEQLRRLRLLWSFMQMWMEWTYAWKRWDEFHNAASPSQSPSKK